MAITRAQGKLLLQLSQFSGLNRRLPQFLISDTQCQDILNFAFDERGALTKVSGYTLWGQNTSPPADRVRGGERYYKTGATPHFVVAYGTSLYKGEGGTFTEIQSGLSSSAQIYAMKSARDLLFILNGVDENKKWDGTNVRKMGLNPPTSAATAADGGSGNLNGTYRWSYTFVSATSESNGAPVSNQLTLTNRQATLSGIATSPDPQVVKRRIYRTLAGGTVYKFVGEINNNTSTTFTDNVADAALGADIPTQNNPPPIGTIIESFKNRLWIAGDSANPRRLYFSEYFEPESWPLTYYVDLPMTPGDEITALKVLGDSMVVYGHNAPFLIIGETPYDFTVKRTFAQIGTESARTVAMVENAHVYMSRFGVHAFDGAVARLLSDDIGPLFRKIPTDRLKFAVAAYHEKNKVYRLAVTSTEGGSSTHNNREFVLDMRWQAWTLTDRPISHYIVLDGPGDFGDLFFARHTGLALFQDDVGSSADGAAILARWKSKAFTLGQIDLVKWLRHLIVWARPLEAPLTVGVILNDDSERSQYFTFPVSTTGSRYGSGTYGSSPYGGPELERLIRSFNQTMVGNYAVFVLEENSTSPLKVYLISSAYRPGSNLRVRF